MKKKLNIEKIIYILIVIVMILIPIFKLSTYIPVIENFYINHFEFKRVYVLWIAIFFLLIGYLYLIFSKKQKIDLVDILMYMLTILAFLSTKYALDFEKSFLGEMYRYEGLLTILSYYLLMLNSRSIKSEKYRKNIIKLFLLMGIVQSIYAILQSYTDFTFIRRHSINYMAMGLCSNPNFFGSYMVMQLLLMGYIYVYDSKKKYLLICILFSIALYLAESTGPVISVVVVFIFSIFVIPKKFKQILRLIIILLISFAFTDWSLKYVQEHKYEREFIPNYDISNEVSTVLKTPSKVVPENLGNGRLEIWKNSIPLVKKYWLIGCGLDNFKNAYPNWGSVKVDKAHNVYLQIAITNGVPALILFLWVLFIVFLRGLKYKNSFLTPLYMAFIGYSVQAFFNISVIDVAPYYFIIIGLILSECKQHTNNEIKVKLFKNIKNQKKI